MPPCNSFQKAIILFHVIILFVVGNPDKHTDCGKKSLSSANSSGHKNQHSLETQNSSRNKKFYLQDLWLLWIKYKAGEYGWTGLLPERGDLDFKILANDWFSAWKTWLVPRSFKFYFLPLTIFGKVIPCKTKGEIAGTKHEIKVLPLAHH